MDRFWKTLRVSIFLMIFGFFALWLTGCIFSTKHIQSTATPKASTLHFTQTTYPRIDGSTATIPLSQAFAQSLIGLNKTDAAAFIHHNTTHDAYVNLINGKADIILVTEPSTEELQLAQHAGVQLEVIPVVKEGFVFLANKKNAVNNLTVAQIQDIYQGKLTNWKQVGGPDSPIVAYQREANSGSQTTMEQMVMKGLKMMRQPTTVVAGMEGLIETVANYDNSQKALGYSFYYYAKNMYVNADVKMLAVNGVAPNDQTIASGTYPYTSSYYAVINKTEKSDSSARKLLAWMLGSEGQKVASQAGYVPLKVG